MQRLTLNLLLALCVCVCMCVNVRTLAQKVQPNVVIIMADDLGFDDVSFRGGQEFLTPNIDALGYHGKILNRMYAPPMCTPSRSALLTGRYPIHTGLQHFVISNEEPWALPSNVTTMAEIFRSAGYSTNLVGKWHLGYAKQEFTPTQRGFDYHYGYWGSYIDYYLRQAKMPNENYNLGYDFRRNMDIECEDLGTYVTDLLTKEAERVIHANNGTKPLFLLLNHLAPHTGNEDIPLQAPPEEIEKFKHIKNPDRRTYAAMISRLDESVGRVVQALASAKMLDNSIVMFYADNGAPAVGQFANSGSNWPLKGQKNSPWEGGVRIAATMWSPLMKKRGTIFEQTMFVGDLLPTLAAAADIKLPNDLDIDGINLWPQLSAGCARGSDSGVKIVEREIVHVLDDIWQVVSYMHGDWKYVNGSTLNGIYDNVLTGREQYEIDPRAQRYAAEIRKSLASQALTKYDHERLTRTRIERLRQAAAVNCGRMQRSCNALLEECLYNLIADPCEQNNLANDAAYHDVLLELRARVEVQRESAWPPGNRDGQLEFDPSRHNCLWTTFLESPPSAVALNCSTANTPCHTSLH